MHTGLITGVRYKVTRISASFISTFVLGCDPEPVTSLQVSSNLLLKVRNSILFILSSVGVTSGSFVGYPTRIFNVFRLSPVLTTCRAQVSLLDFTILNIAYDPESKITVLFYLSTLNENHLVRPVTQPPVVNKICGRRSELACF
jgi:hypothetical protein